MQIQHLMLLLMGIMLLLALFTIGLQFASWYMHAALTNRVAKLEALQNNALTHAESIKIYERLSSIETLAEAQADLLDTIKEHLLERES